MNDPAAKTVWGVVSRNKNGTAREVVPMRVLPDGREQVAHRVSTGKPAAVRVGRGWFPRVRKKR